MSGSCSLVTHKVNNKFKHERIFSFLFSFFVPTPNEKFEVEKNKHVLCSISLKVIVHLKQEKLSSCACIAS